MRANQPTVAGRSLGAELRAIREGRRLSSTKVAQQLGWQQSKISKIETGKQHVTPSDVAALLAIYGVIGQERDRLIKRAESADSPGLWEQQDGIQRDSQTLVRLESEATSIVNLELVVIPGLLQSPDYTRAVMKTGGVLDAELEARVAGRLARQALLSRDESPQVEFIIDEYALRRPMLPPRLLARQLRHIVETAERPNVAVRVLPAPLGGHRGLDGPFMLLEFAKQKSVVHVESKLSTLFLEEEHEIAAYRADVDSLKADALEPDKSVDFVITLAEQLDH